jgi:hypothetical protein
MSKMFLLLSTGVLAAGLVGLGQTTDQPQNRTLGRGRGGAPFAWNDKNKDGICDLTGRPVGQGRPAGWVGGRGRGGPNAWGDKDKDGICDYTGRPVGQRRGAAAGRNSAGGAQGTQAGPQTSEK